MLKPYDKDHFYYNDLLIDLNAMVQWQIDNRHKLVKVWLAIHDFAACRYVLQSIAKFLADGRDLTMIYSQNPENIVLERLKHLKRLGYNLLD